MKFTNTKKIASSALAILLCASMILSFSLSVYAAVDSSNLYVDNGSSITCVATVATADYGINGYKSITHPSVNIANVWYATVTLVITEDGESYEDDAISINDNGANTMDPAEVIAYGTGTVQTASAHHYMYDIDDNMGYAHTQIDN